MPLSLDLTEKDTLAFKLGEREAKEETVRNLHRLNVLTIQQIAEAVNESVTFVRRAIKQQPGDESSASAAQS